MLRILDTFLIQTKFNFLDESAIFFAYIGYQIIYISFISEFVWSYVQVSMAVKVSKASYHGLKAKCAS